MIFFFLILSWAIVAFGQPAWIPWLSPVAAVCGYALFWYAIRTMSQRFWIGTAWFISVQAIQLSWMTATEFQGYYIFLVYGALCIWLGLQFGFLTWTVGRLPHLAVAGLWTLFEWGRLFVLCGFSWNPVGLSLTAFTPSLQAAAIFGVFGLSFCVILTNLALLHKRWAPFFICALLPYLFGWGHLLYHQKKLDQSPKLRVALVQTGLLPPQKIPMRDHPGQFISPFEQWARIIEMLSKVEGKFDLVVFPEFTVPISAEIRAYSKERVEHLLKSVIGKEIAIKDSGDKVSNREWVKTISDLFSAEVVIGLDAQEGGNHFSSAFHMQPNCVKWERYDKQILVPLAEYIPFQWLKRWTASYGIVEFFTHGRDSKIFYGKIPFSTSICYEETFPALMRQGRLKGAKMFVNSTNDNWYPFSRLPMQHCTHARVRSVENGAPLVRACNTGVTAAFDSLGKWVGVLEGEQNFGVLLAQVSTYHYQTLYLFWGDVAIIGLSIAFILISIESLRNYLTCWKWKL